MFTVSNYPDGMTSREGAYLDGGDHHEDCPQHEDFQGITDVSECYCPSATAGGEDYCICDCICDTLYPSKEDEELEKLGL